MIRNALAILLVAVVGCKSAARSVQSLPAPGPSPATLPPAVSTTDTQLDNGWIEVSVSVPRAPAGPKPVVISPIAPDDELTSRGFVVVRFRTNWGALRGFAQPVTGSASVTASSPPAAQTDRSTQVGSWLLAAPRPGIVGRAYFEIISLDAEKVLPRVVDYLTTLPDVDPRRIAITGSSTSGFVALQAMAAEPRIAVGVVRVACGDYMRFLRSSSLALADDPRWLPGGEVVLDPDYAVEIAAREPIRRAELFPPRPLLLLAGEQDRAIPYACVETTVQRFQRAYDARNAGDRFRFIAFPEGGHNLDDAANAAIVPWLERWLQPGVSASRE